MEWLTIVSVVIFYGYHGLYNYYNSYSYNDLYNYYNSYSYHGYDDYCNTYSHYDDYSLLWNTIVWVSSCK